AEVRALIDQAHDEAWKVINDNREILDRLATELLEKETLDHLQLAELFADVKRLPERPQWLSSVDRPLPDLPPVPMPSKAPVDAGALASAAHGSPPPAVTAHDSAKNTAPDGPVAPGD
ncbi:MAG: cell division protein FtsH, partial [Microcella sp.]|nr:cell division protein FtsH [Microcella sp.]